MSQLGERLRTARESQGISLPQAAIETRILQRYLIALEEGDYQHLPGDVYARGFIRNYAQYLGIPAEELIELYRRERGGTDPIRVVPATSSPRIRGFFIPSFFGVFFVVLALVGMTYLVLTLVNGIGEGTRLADLPTPAAPTPSPLPTSQPEPTPAPVVASGPTAAPASSTPLPPAGGAATPTTQVAPTPEAPIVGQVRIASGDNPGSWTRVTVDGQVIYEGILKPNTTQPFSAQRNLIIRVGNAGVVYVTINGQEQGPLGRDGEVMTVNWPPP